MSDVKNQEPEIIMSRVFSKALKKLSDQCKDIIDDEIDNIIEEPEIGVQKKGDLSHMRVHKFKMNNQETLLGYTWVDEKLTLYLLNLGSHENFYKKSKSRREQDLKLIN
jgi:mRNA-degrading endonuclease RelE of RelBE toxin-antitoxin system